MKVEKINVDTACGGELKNQIERAFEAIAANIEKHGAKAAHEVMVKIDFAENPDFPGLWETDVQTAVKCTTRDKEISAKTPVKIEGGKIYDGSSQQKLAFK